MTLTHCGSKEIRTQRLLLRPFRFSDSASMLRHWISDPAVQNMYSEPVYETEAAVRELLEQYVHANEKPDTYRWTITQHKADDSIGQIAFFLVNSEHHFAEVEYCIGQAFQNRGLVTEALQAVVDYGFRQINLHKIQICHKENNPTSRRVIEKNHFVYEGTLRDYFYMDGRYVSRLYYSMLRHEWANLRQAQKK